MKMIESGFSSPRRGAAADQPFPVGLRVLVVDDDPTWLKILEKMLKKCSYEVTTCGLAREALKLLRERKDGFDIVISDVNMPDMDGFKLLEHVGLEMDLPVIMMSVDGETSRVMKGVQHGACDYLLKPIRMKELKNIWQHVIRKRMHEVRDVESIENFEDTLLFRHGMELYDDGHFLSGADQFSIRKRKDVDNRHDDKDVSESSSAKKPRVMWSVDLHQKFVKAVNQIGFDKVGPKKILDLMNIPWLTRENVASHLQKYRLYLSRLEKERELKNGGSKKPDFHPPKETGGNSSLQSSCGSSMLQTDVSVEKFQFPEYKFQFQNTDSKSNEVDLSVLNTLPSAEPKKSSNSDSVSSDLHKAAISKTSLDNSFRSIPENKINNVPIDLTRISPYPWGTNREVSNPSFEFHFDPCQQEVLDLKFESESKPLNQLDNSFTYPSVHISHGNISSDMIHPAASSGQFSLCERGKVGSIEPKLSSVQNEENNIKQPFSMGRANESLLQPQSSVLSSKVSEFCSKTSLMRGNGPVQNGLPGFEGQLNQVLGCSEPAFGSLTDDLSLSCFQGDNFVPNLGFTNTGFSDNYFPELGYGAPFCLPAGLPRFDLDYIYDSVEYPVIDQCVFMTGGTLSMSSR